MTYNFLLEYLSTNETLTNLQTFLKDICRLSFHFLDINGQNLARHTTTQPTPLSSTRIDFPDLFNDTHTNDSHIHNLPIKRTIETAQSQIFNSKAGLHGILVPVKLNERITGFLYVYENENFPLNKIQLQSIAKFLDYNLDRIINQDLKSFNNFKGNQQTHQSKAVDKAQKYILQNYHHPDLSLKVVADKNGLSYYYLSHLFKKQMQTTFSKYVTKVRIDVATKLLQDKSMTISQVAFLCGFDDSGYFCKVFKKLKGTPPAAYRNKLNPTPSQQKPSTTRIDNMPSILSTLATN